jgi:hypothetical protein
MNVPAMKHTARYITSGTTPTKAVTGKPTSQHFFACSLYHTPPLIVHSLDDEMQIARPRIGLTYSGGAPLRSAPRIKKKYSGALDRNARGDDEDCYTSGGFRSPCPPFKTTGRAECGAGGLCTGCLTCVVGCSRVSCFALLACSSLTCEIRTGRIDVFSKRLGRRL